MTAPALAYSNDDNSTAEDLQRGRVHARSEFESLSTFDVQFSSATPHFEPEFFMPEESSQDMSAEAFDLESTLMLDPAESPSAALSHTYSVYTTARQPEDEAAGGVLVVPHQRDTLFSLEIAIDNLPRRTPTIRLEPLWTDDEDEDE